MVNSRGSFKSAFRDLWQQVEFLTRLSSECVTKEFHCKTSYGNVKLYNQPGENWKAICEQGQTDTWGALIWRKCQRTQQTSWKCLTQSDITMSSCKQRIQNINFQRYFCVLEKFSHPQQISWKMCGKGIVSRNVLSFEKVRSHVWLNE